MKVKRRLKTRSPTNKGYGLKKIFNDCRIAALVGKTNCGKSNNLVFLIQEFRQYNPDVPIYIYGFKNDVVDYLYDNFNAIEISSVRQLVNKKNCLFVCDEAQKLKLNDRRYKEEVDEFKNFIYHNNVYCLLSAPDIRMFNTVIGGIIEKWCLKTISLDKCVNGSQLKQAVQSYKGNYKVLGDIVVEKDTIIVVNDDSEIVLTCDYIPEVDTKADNQDIFN